MVHMSAPEELKLHDNAHADSLNAAIRPHETRAMFGTGT